VVNTAAASKRRNDARKIGKPEVTILAVGVPVPKNIIPNSRAAYANRVLLNILSFLLYFYLISVFFSKKLLTIPKALFVLAIDLGCFQYK